MPRVPMLSPMKVTSLTTVPVLSLSTTPSEASWLRVPVFVLLGGVELEPRLLP